MTTRRKFMATAGVGAVGASLADALEPTLKIALAHLAEDPGYYAKLARMEDEIEREWAGREKRIS